jgi:heptosyltransferase-2
MSAKIFTENEINEVVSTQPNIIINENKLKIIKNNFLDNNKHICLGFSASGPTKRWDLENYIKICIELKKKFPCKFYLAGGKNDKDLINKILNSNIGPYCSSFEDLKISETIPIIKNCNLYIGNDTGWLHISSALGIKCVALFMDSPVEAYGKYSDNIYVVVPEGETEATTTHDTLGKEKISFEEVLAKSIKLLN